MNMIKGGYKVIDLSDIALSNVPYEIPGIYAKIQKSFEKAILISNLNIDGEQQQDYFCQPVKTAGGDFTMTVGDYTLTITSSDNVSVAEGIIGGGGSGETYTAGDNIQIQNGVISATDTKYTAGTNIQISEENVISATDTTYSAMTGATSSAAGTSGLVPAPAAGDEDKALCGDGTYHAMSSGGGKALNVKIDGYMASGSNWKNGDGNEIHLTIPYNNTTFTVSGNPADYDVATVEIAIGIGSSSANSKVFYGAGALVKDQSSNKFYFACTLQPKENYPTGTGSQYMCKGMLNYNSSIQEWSLIQNRIVLSTIDFSAKHVDTTISLDSTTAEAIVDQILQGNPTGLYTLTSDSSVSGDGTLSITTDSGSGRTVTGLTISGTTQSDVSLVIDIASANIKFSKAPGTYINTYNIDGVGVATWSESGISFTAHCYVSITFEMNTLNGIFSNGGSLRITAFAP